MVETFRAHRCLNVYLPPSHSDGVFWYHSLSSYPLVFLVVSGEESSLVFFKYIAQLPDTALDAKNYSAYDNLRPTLRLAATPIRTCNTIVSSRGAGCLNTHFIQIVVSPI
jgi:hypothetical protein